MQLIVVNDIGTQKLCSLPSGEPIKNSLEESSKNERIIRMLKAQGKEPEEENQNYIEANFFYLTLSGEEYLKVNLNELWNCIEICNALCMIDSGEFSFYAINVYYSKSNDFENTLGKTSKETNLDSFIIKDFESNEEFSSSIGNLGSCLARGIIKNKEDILQYV